MSGKPIDRMDLAYLDKVYRERKRREEAVARALEAAATNTAPRPAGPAWGAPAIPQQPPPPPKPARLLPQQKLQTMRAMAADLLFRQVAFTDRLPLLRAKAEELELTLRDDELRRLIWDARRAAAGGSEILGPGDAIDITPTRWSWEGMVIPSAFNLLVALPKVGKTSLMLAMLSAWHHGRGDFLGLPLIGPCPPVLIVGTDQPQSDWGRMLLEVDLLAADGHIRPPLVGLAHAGKPIHLTPEGIETIATHAAAHPGLFVLLDSIAAVTGPLGIDENSAEIAEPLRDLVEALEPHGATLVALHHSNKSKAGERASLASRGSTALPAAASQIINMHRMASSNPAGPRERRIVIQTDGRAGEPQSLLIERTADGWICHGTADHVAMAQQLAELEEKLNDRQADALELVRERWAREQRTTAKDLAAFIPGKDAERSARSTLKALQRRHLIQSVKEATLHGNVRSYWPVEAGPAEASHARARVELLTTSYPSEPSDPLLDQEESPTDLWVGSESKEGKDVVFSTTRARATLDPPPGPVHATAPDCHPIAHPGQATASNPARSRRSLSWDNLPPPAWPA